jgi:hypothetical protein
MLSPSGQNLGRRSRPTATFALEMAESSAKGKYLILLDSLSCLQNIENRHLVNPLMFEELTRILRLISVGYEIIFV